MRLTNRVAVVTGGGSGIGRAISELFAAEGAHVVVADLVEARSREVTGRIAASGGKALAVVADVSKAADVRSMATHAINAYGRVDIFVNNAAIAQGDDILTFDEALWDRNLDVVLKSVYLCTRAILPGMIERRQGAIVNIASVNGLTGIGEEAYSAAKAGVINLTKNLAVRYGAYNVRANVICPGTIQTPIWEERLRDTPDIFQRLSAWYPLGRVGQPEDVAKAALFLASDDAAWITGAVLNVDGGLMAGSHKMSQDLAGA